MIRNLRNIDKSKLRGWARQAVAFLVLVGIFWLIKLLPGWIIEREMERQLALLPSGKVSYPVASLSSTAEKNALWSEQPQISQYEIREGLRAVKDPEININVVDMGLIKDIVIDNRGVNITMILTTRFCPYQKNLAQSVKEAARRISGVEHVNVAIDYTATWGISDLTAEGRQQWEAIFGNRIIEQ